MKTKPFNLQAALNGAPCITANGRNVVEISCFKDRGVEFPIRVISVDEEGEKYTGSYTIDGYVYPEHENHKLNLLLIDEEEQLYHGTNKSLILKKIYEMHQYIHDDPAITKYQYHHLCKIINDLKELIEKS